MPSEKLRACLVGGSAGDPFNTYQRHVPLCSDRADFARPVQSPPPATASSTTFLTNRHCCCLCMRASCYLSQTRQASRARVLLALRPAWDWSGLREMDRLRRRVQPAAIDITWVSCRGVRSSLPFHTPCLYASISLTPSKSVQGRRPHRVKTPTDRAGGVNPEWDEHLRLYVPDAASPAPAIEQEAAGGKKDSSRRVDHEYYYSGRGDDGAVVLLVRFELKAEVAVLGDVLAASAVVPVSDLVADGRTRRVSYQLAAPDGRQPNGVISFSYAFHDRSNDVDDDLEDRSSDDGGPGVVTPPSPAALPSPPQSTALSRMYPVIDWPLPEPIAVYPPTTAGTVMPRSSYYYPPPPPVTPVEPVAAYPPLPETSARGMYPTAGEPASGMYPTVDLAPVSCYPPYAAPPEWDGRCLYG